MAFISCRSSDYLLLQLMKAPSLYVFTLIIQCSVAVHRHESGRCYTLFPFLTNFLSFHLPDFPFISILFKEKTHTYTYYETKITAAPFSQFVYTGTVLLNVNTSKVHLTLSIFYWIMNKELIQ